MTTQPAPKTRYIKPDWLTGKVFNPAVGFLTSKLGLSMKGSRLLSVQGRKTGEWRSTPVNPLTFEGERYLVAARGEAHWVRNIRVTHEGRLKLGRKTETVQVEEVPDAEKPPVLRAYLKAWAWEVGKFFEGVSADASDEAMAETAKHKPVFRIKK